MAENGIGAATRRKEDYRFLTGDGHYKIGRAHV